MADDEKKDINNIRRKIISSYEKQLKELKDENQSQKQRIQRLEDDVKETKEILLIQAQDPPQQHHPENVMLTYDSKEPSQRPCRLCGRPGFIVRLNYYYTHNGHEQPYGRFVCGTCNFRSAPWKIKRDDENGDEGLSNYVDNLNLH
jgi:hypothetical protein